MGGEGAHGMIVLSLRAIACLESYTPAWPLPKIFRMTKGGKLIKGIFSGATINTVPVLGVEDAVDGLSWRKVSAAYLRRSSARMLTSRPSPIGWPRMIGSIFSRKIPLQSPTHQSACKITADWYQALPYR